MESCEIDIAGLKRTLPLGPVSDGVRQGSFTVFGDVELTVHCAAEMLKRAPDYDYLIAPEAGSIPLLYEMARQSGENRYFLARRKPENESREYIEAAMSAGGGQKLYLDRADAELIRERRMLIIDDIISTGESLRAVEELVEKAGGEVAGRVFVLAAGPAAEREDVVCLATLPRFDSEGKLLS